MTVSNSPVLQDRIQAANLLAERLMVYKNTNALILAIPTGGIAVGYFIAKMLNLTLDVIPGSNIKHPSNPSEIIGSICMNEVCLNEAYRDVPQDYVYHQVLLHQHGLKAKYKFYREDKAPEEIEGRAVILVTDRLVSTDTIMAAIKSIVKQNPEKIVVAVPVISLLAQQQISHEVDDIIYLLNENGENVYENFDEVTEEDAKDFLTNNMK